MCDPRSSLIRKVAHDVKTRERKREVGESEARCFQGQEMVEDAVFYRGNSIWQGEQRQDLFHNN